MPEPVRLMTLDPGHFHAALVQKEMLPGVDPVAYVYAPPGPDLRDHLDRIAAFNSRADNPTSWQIRVYSGDDYFERMLRERPGNVVVLSGRNKGKIDRILACLEAGLHVLADKPWIIDADDWPKLDRALALARARGLVAYDMMTERYEITTLLQRELVSDPEVLGGMIAPDGVDAVSFDSVHYLKKLVSGTPLRRPPRFFDVEQTGEGLNDVGTHLVDLFLWMWPDDWALPNRESIEFRNSYHRAVWITSEQFHDLTGMSEFPAYLAPFVQDGVLAYYGKNYVELAVGSLWVSIEAEWAREAPAGFGDEHFAQFWGTKSRIRVLQDRTPPGCPQLYIWPHPETDAKAIGEAIQRRVTQLAHHFPGLAVVGSAGVGSEFQITIPDEYRVGHEAHFAQVFRQFLEYVREPQALPTWEDDIMRVKYWITTEGVALARQRQGGTG